MYVVSIIYLWVSKPLKYKGLLLTSLDKLLKIEKNK